MSCKPKIEEDSYDFFDIIDNYIKDGKVISNDKVPSDQLHNCSHFSEEYTPGINSVIGKDICEKFLKLYTSISNLRDNKISPEYYKKDCNFLNYWLNFKLRESILNKSVCIEDFSFGIENQCFDTLTYDYTLKFIYHISEEDFRKMKLLYILYENYSILDSILSKSTNEQNDAELLLKHSSKCYDDYKEAINMCYGNKKPFCQKLEKFKSKYQSAYVKVQKKGGEFSKNFRRLPEDENSNIISTATIGTAVGLIPLFGVLYKFTPLGQLFKHNKIKLTNEYSNNDEMRNILSMDQERKSISSQQEKYNIKYQSL